MLTKKNLLSYCKLLSDILNGEEKKLLDKFISQYKNDKSFREEINLYVFENENKLEVIPNQLLHFIRNLSHYIKDEKDMVL